MSLPCRCVLGWLMLPAALAATLAVPASTSADFTYHGVAARNDPASITVKVHKAAAFRVVLRARTVGRTQLFLTGKNAPKGGPLIDTKTHSCEGAAGSFYCRGSYEPLPRGTYTWRIVRVSGSRENVTLTVRW